jgi:hypothetical protein
VTVLVPADRLEEAAELLEDLLESFGGEPGPADPGTP